MKIGDKVRVEGHWKGDFTGIVEYNGVHLTTVKDDRDGEAVEIPKDIRLPSDKKTVGLEEWARVVRINVI